MRKLEEILEYNKSFVENKEYDIKPILNTFIYAGFQSVVIPTLAGCSRPLLKNSKEATKAMIIS
ncbi:hypothetical protein ACTPD5_20940, partial [Clostridioides difficile]